eukprot:m.124898 g.124898  ORF g.124898 m.124898 type:complete len:77 (+) comp29088_c0_seq1:1386-1616(+)
MQDKIHHGRTYNTRKNVSHWGDFYTTHTDVPTRRNYSTHARKRLKWLGKSSLTSKCVHIKTSQMKKMSIETSKCVR